MDLVADEPKTPEKLAKRMPQKKKTPKKSTTAKSTEQEILPEGNKPEESNHLKVAENMETGNNTLNLDLWT